MTQTALCFDRPSPEALGFKSLSQNSILYCALCRGPVSNGYIVYGLRIQNSTGRISDIRKALRPYLMDVRATPDPVDPSRVVYRLVG